MSDFKDRVQQEKLELNTKIEKLNSFIGSTKFYDLSSDEQYRLRRQHIIMTDYYNILYLRIVNYFK
jgi:hypothetical protein